jgi:hypothetical protein
MLFQKEAKVQIVMLSLTQANTINTYSKVWLQKEHYDKIFESILHNNGIFFYGNKSINKNHR